MYIFRHIVPRLICIHVYLQAHSSTLYCNGTGAWFSNAKTVALTEIKQCKLLICTKNEKKTVLLYVLQNWSWYGIYWTYTGHKPKECGNRITHLLLLHKQINAVQFSYKCVPILVLPKIYKPCFQQLSENHHVYMWCWCFLHLVQ